MHRQGELQLSHCLVCKGSESFNVTPKMDFLNSCFCFSPQILMNVQVLKQIPVTLMPCVPTLRVLTFVAVYKGIVVMGKIVQVKLQSEDHSFKMRPF